MINTAHKRLCLALETIANIRDGLLYQYKVDRSVNTDVFRKTMKDFISVARIIRTEQLSKK